MLHIILGAVMLGLLWALMTIGVYITYRILDMADLTVEGSIALGAAIAAQGIFTGLNPFAGFRRPFIKERSMRKQPFRISICNLRRGIMLQL